MMKRLMLTLLLAMSSPASSQAPALLAVVWLAGVATPDYTGPISAPDSVDAVGASSSSGDTDAALIR